MKKDSKIEPYIVCPYCQKLTPRDSVTCIHCKRIAKRRE